MSSTANRIIKNTGVLYAKMGITMFISLYTTRLILNSLGASDFGIFNIVGGSIAMLDFLMQPWQAQHKDSCPIQKEKVIRKNKKYFQR